MLDFDLAEIYGYSVSTFNQQVKRNILDMACKTGVVRGDSHRREQPRAYGDRVVHYLVREMVSGAYSQGEIAT